MKGIFAGALLGALIVFFAPSAFAGPVAKLAEATYDFGRVEAGRQLSHDFRLTNAGDADLSIEGLSPS